MWKPVGPLGAGVYWRRRALAASGAVLVVVTVVVLLLSALGPGSSSDGAAAPATSASEPAQPSSSSDGAPAGAPVDTAAATASSSAAPAAGGSPTACTGADLRISASTSLPSYPVGVSPGLNMVVTNIGAQPCVADLSDSNIVLVVYFGEARIWGSHDCTIEPGSAAQTLPVNEPVTRQIVWTGLSSNEGCTATRQRVGPGTYTLQPVFAGQSGAPVTFTIA